MKKDKVLLTGGTGFIGSHTAVELIQAGYEVEILDNLYNSKITALDNIEKITGVRPKFHKVDIRDIDGMKKVFAEGKFDTVIHFAGLKAVAESVEKPLMYYEVNIGGTINLLECMQEFGVHKIIFSSSATVYGEPDSPLCVESLPVGRNLANPYGRTKYFIEEILRDVAVSDPEFKVTILRYFNPIGAHPSGLLGEDPNDKPNNLMPIVMKVAAGEIPELSIFGDDYDTPDGTCIRDYIHVVDLAKGHVAAVEKIGGDEQVQVYNLGTGRGLSVMEIVKAFSKASGMELPHKIVGRRAGDLAALCADPSHAEEVLGWKTELTIDDAMRDTLNYLEKQGVKIR